MANRVTNEDIIRINEIYYKTHTYAETARQVGFSPATVKKYVIPGWEPVEEVNIIKFDLKDLPEFSTELFKNVDNYGDLCILSTEEREKIKELWEEIVL